MTKQEIKKELQQSFENLQTWYKEQPDSNFDQGPENKWTAGQHLDHLHKSTKMINKALGMPKIALRWKFGVANRPSRSMEGLTKKYKDKIDSLPPDFKQPAPPVLYPPEKKNTRLERIDGIGKQMITFSQKWSDKNLDKYILPHPAIGKCTIREFFMWTVIHNEHHLNILKRDYT